MRPSLFLITTLSLNSLGAAHAQLSDTRPGSLLAPVPLPDQPVALDPAPAAKARVLVSKSTARAALPSSRLPEPALPADATPADYLRAARGAVAAGRTNEAHAALEMAQTRLLTRSVKAGEEDKPSDDLAVKQISEAIEALVSNDRMNSLRYIELASATIGSPLN